MFNPWLTLSFKAVQMGTEAQSVVAFRMLHFASGGARSEATRMVAEKVAASSRCGRGCYVGVSLTLSLVRRSTPTKSVYAPTNGGCRAARSLPTYDKPGESPWMKTA